MSPSSSGETRPTADSTQAAGSDVASTTADREPVETSLIKRRIQSIKSDIRNPLYRNAYALMLNTAITSFLGVVYVAVAARLYTSEEFGLGSGVVSAMMLISSLTQLNFMQVLIRFMPRAGRYGKKLLLSAYAITVSFAMVATTVFLVVAKLVAPNWQLVDFGLPMAASFVIATGAWTVFCLQDSALTGLRQTIWLPIENGSFGLAKVVLLFAFLPMAGASAVYASWAVPLLLAAVPVNYLIFRHFLPSHATSTPDEDHQKPEPRKIAKFIAGDYLGNVCGQLSTTLMPVLVIATLDERANSYFYVAQMIAVALDLVAINLAASLTVEASRAEHRAVELTKATIRRVMTIVVGAGVTLMLAAPLLLGVFNSEYSQHSTTLLRLLLLASIPKALTAIYGSWCRVHHLTHRIGMLQVTQTTLFIALSVFLMHRMGVVGVGIAALIGQSVIALYVVPSLIKSLRSGGASQSNSTPDEVEDEVANAEAEISSISVLQPFPTAPVSSGLTPSSFESATSIEYADDIQSTYEPRPSTLRYPEEKFETPLQPNRNIWQTKSMLVGLLIPLGLLIGGLFSVSGVDARLSGNLGLVQALPISYFVIMGALAVSFVLHVRKNAHGLVLAIHLGALIFLLHGLPAWIEENPRFATAYTHVGFVDFIQRHDAAGADLDARMSWPGFFALGALLNEVAGVSTFSFLLWAPSIVNFAYAPLVWSIARSATEDRRVVWFATWLFFSASWIGQDYFAPQAFNFLLFLTFIAVLLRVFRSDAGLSTGPLKRFSRIGDFLARKVLRSPELVPGGSPLLPVTPIQRALLIAVLLVVYAAMIVSHQLTPFFLLLDVGALAILSRTYLRGLPWLLLISVFTWISYGASGFWMGHLNEIFGGAGDVGGTINKNVSDRAASVKSNHVWVIYGRLALSFGLWALACLGTLRRLRKGRNDLTIVVCFFAPFLILGGQSYGGEAALRVFLFSLPFVAILAVFALLPTAEKKMSIFKTAIACLVAVTMVPAFVTARYGNERFEYISQEEYQAVQELYRIAPPGASLGAFDPNSAWQIKSKDLYEFHAVFSKYDFEDTDVIYKELMKKAPNGEAFLLLTRAQIEAIAFQKGLPRTWGDDETSRLVSSGKFKVVYENRDARIFQAVK